MTQTQLRHQVRIMQIVTALSSLALVVIVCAALQTVPAPTKFDEITVGRINVAEPDGTIRMVFASSARQAPGRVNGKTLAPDRKRPAGILLFNDEGDETGGLVFSGRGGMASQSLTFDQYKQDQVVSVSANEDAGRRLVGLTVRDRSAIPLDEFLEKYEAAQRLASDDARRAAMTAIGALGNGALRVFVGKDADRAALLTLADAHGTPRLRLKVAASGASSIEFLDENGQVERSLP